MVSRSTLLQRLNSRQNLCWFCARNWNGTRKYESDLSIYENLDKNNYATTWRRHSCLSILDICILAGKNWKFGQLEHFAPANVRVFSSHC